jgi:hypothetical protein
MVGSAGAASDAVLRSLDVLVLMAGRYRSASAVD